MGVNTDGDTLGNTGYSLAYGPSSLGRHLVGDSPWTLMQYYAALPSDVKVLPLSAGLRRVASGKLRLAKVNVEFVP